MGGTNRHGAAEARRAHNPEDIRSKRITGIHYTSVALKKRPLEDTTFNRGGAGEARGAHNPEDVGSNPTSGIIIFRPFTEEGGHS